MNKPYFTSEKVTKFILGLFIFIAIFAFSLLSVDFYMERTRGEYWYQASAPLIPCVANPNVEEALACLDERYGDSESQ